MFERGAKYKDTHASYTVKLVELAPVELPTGRIYAGDPFTLNRLEPFERRVKRGTYSITASIAKIVPLKKGCAQERVAAAMLRVGKGEPVRWINATKPAQKLSRLRDGAFYGYGVDSGTGCFCDLSAALALKALDEVEHANDNWEGWLMAKLRKGMLESKQAWGSGSAVTVPDKRARANVVAFSSGWGDGFYGSWWGLSRKGEPLCLVTDFGVLPEPPPPRVVSRS